MCVSMQWAFAIQRVRFLLENLLTSDSHEIFLSILGLVHKLQRAVFLETDSPEILGEAITIVRKGGTVAIVGD